MDRDMFKALSELSSAVQESDNLLLSKQQNLQQKREEKLQNLGANKQNANLDNSYTTLPSGNIEHNGNKIWNDENAAGIQTALSDASNQQIFTREDGSKYQKNNLGHELDYKGETRRAYMYGTKNDDEAVKFGLARGDLPSSDYRYQPGRAKAEGYKVSEKDGYGWDAGPEGVDLNKKYMDMELPYEVATSLEALVHGRKDALAHRKYPNRLSDKAIQHAGGVSEYYTSATGMLGDSRNQEDPKKSVLEKYSKIPQVQAPKKYESKEDRLQRLLSGESDVPDYNLARGFGSSVLNAGSKLWSGLGAAIEDLGEQSDPKAHGVVNPKYHNRQKGIFEDAINNWFTGTGDEIQKDMTEYQLNNDANKVTGYDPKNVEELSGEINTLIKEEGLTGWVKAAGKVVTDPRTIEVLVNSTPEMALLAVSAGGMGIVNASNNINLGEAKLGREFTDKEKAQSVAISIASTYLDRLGDKMALGSGNATKATAKGAVKALEAIKVLPKASQDAIKKKYSHILNNKYVNAAVKVGAVPAKMVGAGIVEGLTEKGQTLGEMAAQDPEVVKNREWSQKQLDESNVAAVLGFGMGTQMQAAGQAYRGLTDSDNKELIRESTQRAKGVFSSETDSSIPKTFIGQQNRFETVRDDPEFKIDPEDKKTKEAYTNASVNFAVQTILVPKNNEVSGYKDRTFDVIKDLEGNLAKIHGVETEVGKQFIADEVTTKLFAMTRAKDDDDGQRLLNEDDKELLITAMGDSFKGNKYAEKALEREMKNDLNDKLDEIKSRLKIDSSDPLSIATEEELKSLLDVTKSMKTFGSESLTQTATKIEDALVKVHKVLGSGTRKEEPKVAKAKTMNEVAEEIETLGFLYEGRNFKSIKDHADDLELFVEPGSVDLEEKSESTLKALEVFASNRGVDKLEAVKTGKGLKNESAKELFSVGEIVNLNKQKISETTKLLNVTNKSLASETLTEDSRQRLEAVQTFLTTALEDHQKIAKMASDSQYSKLYNTIATDDQKLFVNNELAKDPKLRNRAPRVDTFEEEQYDEDISFTDADGNPVEFNKPYTPTIKDVALKIVSKEKMLPEDLQVQRNEGKALELELIRLSKAYKELPKDDKNFEYKETNLPLDFEYISPKINEPSKTQSQEIREAGESKETDIEKGSTAITSGSIPAISDSTEEVKLDYETPYENVETFLKEPVTLETQVLHNDIISTQTKFNESVKEVELLDESINQVEQAEQEIISPEGDTDKGVQTVLSELDKLIGRRGIVADKVRRLQDKIKTIDRQRRRIYNAKRGPNELKTAQSVTKRLGNKLIESVKEALEYIKKYRKAINTRLRSREKELKAIDTQLKEFYTPERPSKPKKRRSNTQAERLKKASEIEIGGSEEEAKLRGQSVMKSTKTKEETYTEDDVAYLDSLEEDPYVSDFDIVEPTNTTKGKVTTDTQSKQPVSPSKSEESIDKSGAEEKSYVDSIIDPKLKEEDSILVEKVLSELELAQQRVTEAKKRLDSVEAQRQSGNRLKDSTTATHKQTEEEVQYQFTLISNEIRGLRDNLQSLNLEKDSLVAQLFNDKANYVKEIQDKELDRINKYIKFLNVEKKKTKAKIEPLLRRIDWIEKTLKRVNKLPASEQLNFLQKVLNKVLEYVDSGIATLLGYRDTVRNKIKREEGRITIINEELSKQYDSLEELKSRMENRRVLRKPAQERLNRVKEKLEETHESLKESNVLKKEVREDLQSAKTPTKVINNAQSRIFRDLKDSAQTKLDEAVDSLASTRRKIEGQLGRLVVPNNSTEIGVSSVLSSGLDRKGKVDYLMTLMPKIIKESKGGLKRVDKAITVFEDFMKNKHKGFVNQETKPNDKEEDVNLNPLLQEIFGSSFNSTITNNLDNKVKKEVRTAMHMASLLTLADTTSMRNMPGELLDKAIKGSFSVVLAGDKDLSFVKQRALKNMIKSGEMVPEATFAISAGREFIKQLEIKLDTKSKIKGQTADDITLALGYLVVNNLLPQQLGKGNEISKKVVTFDEKEGMVIRDRVQGSDAPATNVLDLRDLTEEYIKGIIEAGGTFEYASTSDNGMINTEPKVFKNGKKTKNSKGNNPDGATEYLNKQNAVKQKFSDSFGRLWNTIEGKTREERVSTLKEIILGNYDDVVAKAPTISVKSVIARYRANALVIDRMMMAEELAEGRDFYIEWDYLTNGRNSMNNKMLNTQSSGISRFVVSTEGVVNKVDKSKVKDNDLYALKAAIAQALDIGKGIDKDTDKNVFNDLEKLVKITSKGGVIKVEFPEGSKLETLVNGEFNTKAVKEAGFPTASKSILHVYQAIDFLQMVQDPSVTQFETNLALEIDGITNGMSITLMQMGWSDFTKGHLERTGVYSEDSKYRTHGEFKADNGLDVYQASITNIQEQLGPIVTKLIDDIIDGKWRNFMKNPVMIFIYGANLSNIVEAVAMSLVIGNSYIKGGLNGAKFEELKELALTSLPELEALGYKNLDGQQKSELYKLQQIKKLQPTFRKYNLETGKFDILNKNSLTTEEQKQYAYINDTAIALLSSSIAKVIGPAFKEGFKGTFKDVTEYRQSLKMVEEANYAIFKVAFKQKLVERGIDNGRLGELTTGQLNEVIEELRTEGVYYSSKNAVQGEGEQDYFKTDKMEGTEADTIRVKLSPSKYQSTEGYYKQVNQVVKDLQANVGSVGVVDVHNVDGTIMIEGHIKDVLNVYDALMLGTNAEANYEQSQAMNQAFYDVTIRHSILGRAVEKLVKNAPKYITDVRKSGLGNELFEDINRIFEISKSDSGVLNESTFVDGVMRTLEKTDANRRQLAKEELHINQYYVTDDVPAIKGTTDESTLERHAVFTNANDLVENEKDIIRQMLKALVEVANEGAVQAETNTSTHKKKESPKKDKGTISREQVPEELSKILDDVKDEKIKNHFKKWLEKNLDKMEKC